MNFPKTSFLKDRKHNRPSQIKLTRNPHLSNPIFTILEFINQYLFIRVLAPIACLMKFMLWQLPQKSMFNIHTLWIYWQPIPLAYL